MKQSGSVSEYQQRFEELAHGILLYNSAFDDTYMVTRFLGGLKEEIRGPIALHRPKDIDTASALALLQEEELENSKRKSGFRDTSKASFRTFSTPEKAKVSDSDKAKSKPVEGKLGSLKAYRRENGLCFKYGEKWGPGHKCPTHVSIHVVEELLDAIDEEVQSENIPLDESVDSDGVMAIGNTVAQSQAK